ncbi:Cys-tRNA(Pro) deacylase [Desemzia sp. RIT804]|uniref:Cys-tRNA(Pro) deacylase n=1 Tax=Desemzia sp. RIT 804 TaxID=2810209 RepID=UPI0019528D41|nr:Cys-tRNA(Pro) deacylase [Desemzia sp. RIT 804]MBM6614401.1 Cys-tRNA(Pro) deacylase [Desemzia sp. RIT 804]
MGNKAKHQKTNAIRILEKNAISFQVHTFPWSEDHLGAEEAIEKLAVPKEQIFKTLVTIGDKTGVVVAVIPGTSELNLKSLARASGNKKIEMLPMNALLETTGYVRGGCSPIGMKKNFPTYLSAQAIEMDRIIVSAGKRGMQVELASNDLVSITHGSFAEIEAVKF